MMQASELKGLTDDQLIGLIVAAKKEAQRRGIEAEAESWATVLADGERDTIARAAAEREAKQLQDEERRRVAAEAADRVRREAERKRQQEQAEAATAQAAKIRGIAVRARELFGSDVERFDVEVWDRSGDRRVYAGGGYEKNWIEYYHTGNARVAPGTLKVLVPAVVRDLAAHLDITADEAKVLIRDFCAGLCGDWKTLKVEATPDNAPRDPRCRIEEYVLFRDKQASGYHSHQYGRLLADGRPDYTTALADATRYPSAEAALADLPRHLGDDSRSHIAPAAKADEVTTKTVSRWLAFAPKGGA